MGQAVDQPMQQVQHMRLCSYALIQSKLHGPQHDLFVVMEDEGKNIGHLTITAGAAKHLVLQLSEGQRQFQEGCTIAQDTGLALDDGKLMPPVVNRSRWLVVAPLNDPDMPAKHITLGRNNQFFRINPQADRPVRKRCWYAIAIALEGDKTCRRDPLALFDEAIKHGGECHQCCPFISPDISDRAGQGTMRRLLP